MNRSIPHAEEGERLAKRVAQMVPCSRREAEQYIEGGWVSVNGVVVEEPHFRVTQQTITLDPNASLLDMTAITLLLHKPPHFLDGTDDDDEDDEDEAPAPKRPGPNAKTSQAKAPRGKAVKKLPDNARSLLTVANHCAQDPSDIKVLKRHFNHLEASVELETGASGLCVFTQDWRTARKLNEDMGSMEHELIVDVQGEVSGDSILHLTKILNDPRNALPQAKVSINSAQAEHSKLRFAIKGSHPGLVAYLCERAQLNILAMRRIRLGRVALSDLPVGQWRFLAGYERF